jgi:hypothetical protein
MEPKGIHLPRVHPSMYRSSLDGLSEQIRFLEEQKRRLEADLVGLKRMRWPQRAFRISIAALVFSGTGSVGWVLGYRHAAIQVREAAERDAWAYLERIDQCDEQRRELLALKRGREPKGFDEEQEP